jgi:DNA-binding LytR/AlgR family response regulator
MKDPMKMRAVIFCTNPEPLKKLRKTLRTEKRFELVGACQTMPDVMECIQRYAPDVLLLEGKSPLPATQLAVRSHGRTIFVKVEELDYIKAARNVALLYAGQSCHRVRTTLAALGKKLPRDQFFRVNRSVIVNLERVREVRRIERNGPRLVLETGNELSLTRRVRIRDIRDRLELC